MTDSVKIDSVLGIDTAQAEKKIEALSGKLQSALTAKVKLDTETVYRQLRNEITPLSLKVKVIVDASSLQIAQAKISSISNSNTRIKTTKPSKSPKSISTQSAQSSQLNLAVFDEMASYLRSIDQKTPKLGGIGAILQSFITIPSQFLSQISGGFLQKIGEARADEFYQPFLAGLRSITKETQEQRIQSAAEKGAIAGLILQEGKKQFEQLRPIASQSVQGFTQQFSNAFDSLKESILNQSIPVPDSFLEFSATAKRLKTFLQDKEILKIDLAVDGGVNKQLLDIKQAIKTALSALGKISIPVNFIQDSGFFTNLYDGLKSAGVIELKVSEDSKNEVVLDTRKFAGYLMKQVNIAVPLKIIPESEDATNIFDSLKGMGIVKIKYDLNNTENKKVLINIPKIFAVTAQESVKVFSNTFNKLISGQEITLADFTFNRSQFTDSLVGTIQSIFADTVSQRLEQLLSLDIKEKVSVIQQRIYTEINNQWDNIRNLLETLQGEGLSLNLINPFYSAIGKAFQLPTFQSLDKLIDLNEFKSFANQIIKAINIEFEDVFQSLSSEKYIKIGLPKITLPSLQDILTAISIDTLKYNLLDAGEAIIEVIKQGEKSLYDKLNNLPEQITVSIPWLNNINLGFGDIETARAKLKEQYGDFLSQILSIETFRDADTGLNKNKVSGINIPIPKIISQATQNNDQEFVSIFDKIQALIQNKSNFTIIPKISIPTIELDENAGIALTDYNQAVLGYFQKISTSFPDLLVDAIDFTTTVSRLNQGLATSLEQGINPNILLNALPGQIIPQIEIPQFRGLDDEATLGKIYNDFIQGINQKIETIQEQVPKFKLAIDNFIEITTNGDQIAENIYNTVAKIINNLSDKYVIDDLLIPIKDVSLQFIGDYSRSINDQIKNFQSRLKEDIIQGTLAESLSSNDERINILNSRIKSFKNSIREQDTEQILANPEVSAMINDYEELIDIYARLEIQLESLQKEADILNNQDRNRLNLSKEQNELLDEQIANNRKQLREYKEQQEIARQYAENTLSDITQRSSFAGGAVLATQDAIAEKARLEEKNELIKQRIGDNKIDMDPLGIMLDVKSIALTFATPLSEIIGQLNNQIQSAIGKSLNTVKLDDELNALKLDLPENNNFDDEFEQWMKEVAQETNNKGGRQGLKMPVMLLPDYSDFRKKIQSGEIANNIIASTQEVKKIINNTLQDVAVNISFKPDLTPIKDVLSQIPEELPVKLSFNTSGFIKEIEDIKQNWIDFTNIFKIDLKLPSLKIDIPPIETEDKESQKIGYLVMQGIILGMQYGSDDVKKTIRDIIDIDSALSSDKIKEHWIKTYKSVQDSIDKMSANSKETGKELQANLSEASPGPSYQVRTKWKYTVGQVQDYIKSLEKSVQNGKFTPNQKDLKNYGKAYLESIEKIKHTRELLIAKGLDPSADPIVKANLQKQLAMMDQLEESLKKKLYVIQKSLSKNGGVLQEKQVKSYLQYLIRIEQQLEQVGNVKIPDNRISTQAKQATQAVAEQVQNTTQKAIDTATPVYKRFVNLIKEQTQKVKESSKAFLDSHPQISKFINFVKTAGLAIIGFLAAKFAFDNLIELGRAVQEIRLQFSGLETSIRFASGSFKEGEKDLANLTKMATDLKIAIIPALEGYIQLKSAIKDTKFDEQYLVQNRNIAEEITQSVSQAAVAYNLSADRLKNAQLALVQIAGKGLVSQEELRQQLSEQLPGAMQVAARAFGVTTQELNKMVESGLLAEEFLPKFAAQLRRETAYAVAASQNTINRAMQNLQNQQQLVANQIGMLLEPAAIAAYNALANALKLIVPIAQTLVPTLVELAQIAAYLGTVNLAKWGYGVAAAWIQAQLASKALIFNFKGLSAAALSFGQSLLTIKAGFNTYSLVAIGVIHTLWTIADGYNQTRNASKYAIESMTKDLEELSRVSKQTLLSNDIKQITEANRKALLDSMNLAEKTANTMGKIGKNMLTGGLLPVQLSNKIPLATYENNKLNASIAAQYDLFNNINNVLGSGLDLRNKIAEKQEVTAIQIEKQLDALYTARQALIDTNTTTEYGTQLKEQQIKLIDIEARKLQEQLDIVQGINTTYAEIVQKRDRLLIGEEKRYTTFIEGLEEQVARGYTREDQINVTRQKMTLDNIRQQIAIQKDFAKSIKENENIYNSREGKEVYKKTLEEITTLEKEASKQRIEVLKSERQSRIDIINREYDKLNKDIQAKVTGADIAFEFSLNDEVITQSDKEAILSQADSLTSEFEAKLKEIDDNLAKTTNKDDIAQLKNLQYFYQERLKQVQNASDAMIDIWIDEDNMYKDILSDQAITAEELELVKLNQTLDRINAEIEAEKEKVNQLIKVNGSQEDIQASMTNIYQKQLEYQQTSRQITQKTKELDSARKEQQKAIREEQQKQRDLQSQSLDIDKQRLELDRSRVDQYELQVKAIEKQAQGLDLISAKLQSEQSIINARNSASESVASREVERLNTALELVQKLNNKEYSSNEEKRAILAQLAELGINGSLTEESIKQRILDLTRAQSDLKLKALREEQAIQRQLLELEIKKEELSARRAVNDAQSALLKAKLEAKSQALESRRSVKDAESEVIAKENAVNDAKDAIAKSKTDAERKQNESILNNANVELKLAKEKLQIERERLALLDANNDGVADSVELANQALSVADANYRNQLAINQGKVEEQRLTQSSELAQAQQEAILSDNAAQLEAIRSRYGGKLTQKELDDREKQIEEAIAKGKEELRTISDEAEKKQKQLEIQKGIEDMRKGWQEEDQRRSQEFNQRRLNQQSINRNIPSVNQSSNLPSLTLKDLESNYGFGNYRHLERINSNGNLILNELQRTNELLERTRPQINTTITNQFSDNNQANLLRQVDNRILKNIRDVVTESLG